MLSDQEIADKRAQASGVRGVYFDARSDKFVAEVKKGGKRIGLGSYSTLDEAAEAYRRAKPGTVAQKRIISRKAEPQARQAPRPQASNEDGRYGLQLWSSVPDYLRTADVWSVAAWRDYQPSDAQMRQIAAWAEHCAIREAKALVFGWRSVPLVDGSDGDFWRAEAARRDWPTVILPEGPEDLDQAIARSKARVGHWEAYLRRTGASGAGLIDLLATTLPESPAEASVAEFSDLV